jgi:inner membrane protein involved in colicin E2 resistance
MAGFGQVWLPAPIKAPLGPLSYLWLAGNAFIGYALAFIIASVTLPSAVALPFIIALSGATGAAYGALNEQSMASVGVSVLFPAIAGLVVWRHRLMRSASYRRSHQ